MLKLNLRRRRAGMTACALALATTAPLAAAATAQAAKPLPGYWCGFTVTQPYTGFVEDEAFQAPANTVNQCINLQKEIGHGRVKGERDPVTFVTTAPNSNHTDLSALKWGQEAREYVKGPTYFGEGSGVYQKGEAGHFIKGTFVRRTFFAGELTHAGDSKAVALYAWWVGSKCAKFESGNAWSGCTS